MSRRSGRWAPTVALALCLACLGCPAEEDAGLQPVDLPTDHIDHDLLCDAGDEAFIREAVSALWGRFPLSIREVEVLGQVLAQTDRATLIRRMARSPEYRARWSPFLLDALGVPRIGVQAKPACTGEPLMTSADPALAAHVRDIVPGGAAFGAQWNLADLVRSSLALDDISPVYLAALFTQQASVLLPPIEGDGNLIGEEEANRKSRSAAFQRSYLHRSLVCIGCHNSSFATTDSADPATDRHWPLEGHLELALFGDHTGRPADDLAAFFRTGGVVAVDTIEQPEGPPEYVMAEGVAPWGIAFDCGRFVEPGTITPDPFEMSGYFVASHPTGSVWDLEGYLRAGFAGLRADGLDVAANAAVNGDEAFAQLVALNIVDQVWAELTGNRLTIVNAFPRNQLQRDTLQQLAATFVSSGFSLVELLVAITTHPLYNQAAPTACFGPSSPYHLPPVFDPWTVDLEDPGVRGNSVGDTIRRRPPRVLLGAVTAALGWKSPASFFTGADEGYVLPAEGQLQRDIGVFLKDSEMGFRGTDVRGSLAWETAYGACIDPSGAGADFITELVAAASPGHTLEDAVLALKDRLTTDPDLSDDVERGLLEDLVGASLKAPLTSDPHAEGRLRRVCGALLQSPQVLLVGLSMAPRRGTSLALVPEGTSVASLCEKISTELFDVGEASCTADAITVSKEAQP